MEKSGFIYIWYDRKHKRYYVGSHWGRENDGYICSSRWMRKAYRRRPSDFRRRIIARVTTSRRDLLIEENRWLKMIRDDELGNRFYNLTKHLNGHWSTDDGKRMTVGEKISASPLRRERIKNKAIGREMTDETKEKLRVINTGKKLSEETKRKISENHNRVYDNKFRQKISVIMSNRSVETRKKISENSKRLQAEGRVGMKGKQHRDETRQKMSNSALGMKNHRYGMVWVTNGSESKMVHPDSIPTNWYRGRITHQSSASNK